MPSVDKVGRYFPLTIVSELSCLPTTERELRALCQWLDQIETLAVSTLDTTCSLQRFDDELLAIPPPWEPPAPSRISLARHLLATLQDDAMALLELPSADALPETLADVGGLLSAAASRGVSLWWAPGRPGSGAPLVVHRVFPTLTVFCYAASCTPPQPANLAMPMCSTLLPPDNEDDRTIAPAAGVLARAPSAPPGQRRQEKAYCLSEPGLASWRSSGLSDRVASVSCTCATTTPLAVASR